MKITTSNLSKWSISSLAVVAALSLAGTAQAQPNPNDTAKGTNPPNWQQGGNGGGRPNFQNMTPEQRQQFAQQMQEQAIRRRLTNAGFADNATQDPIVVFMTAQDKARQTLRDRFAKLSDALIGNAATDTELSTSLNDLHQAVAEEKTRRDAALKDLDEKVSYSKKPHLEALLTVWGIIGDEASLAAGGLGGRMGGGGRGMGGMGLGGLGGGGLNNNFGGGGGQGAGGGLFGGRRRGNRGNGGNGGNGANNGLANPGANGGANLQAATPVDQPPVNQ